MPQDIADLVERRTFPGHVGRKTMAQQMRTYVLLRRLEVRSLECI
jgi:hypothetical protein